MQNITINYDMQIKHIIYYCNFGDLRLFTITGNCVLVTGVKILFQSCIKEEEFHNSVLLISI